MSVEALKLELIDTIMALKDAQKLRKIKATIRDLWPQEEDNDDVIKRLNKPMRKRIDIEELKEEQGYKPINKEEFFKKIDALDIEEPLEELLRMI